MKKYNKKIPTEEIRAVTLAQYIVENDSTVREAARVFSVSKSTVHKDVTTKLCEINPALFAAVNEVLQKNKAVRHLRGGEATKKKYSKTKGGNKNAAYQRKNDERKNRGAEEGACSSS